MKKSLFLKLIITLSCIGFLFSLGAQSDKTFKINYKGNERIFIVHIPTGYTHGDHLPLVIAFHGGSNAADFQARTKFDFLGDTFHFISVFPQAYDVRLASRSLWADTRGTVADILAIDDVAFTSYIIDTLIMLYKIDTTRIYAAGLSAGGYFCQRLALQLNHRIAAFACVASSLTTSLIPYFTPSRKIPMLFMNGTNDTRNPYNGGPAGSVGTTINTEIAFASWKYFNNCPISPTVFQYPDINTGDTSTVTRITYSPCQNCSEVILYRINNGGHTWPGAPNNPTLGLTNMDINGSLEIWSFFKRHHLLFPLKSSASNSDQDLLPDRCDPCPLDVNNDTDGDGVCGNLDNCPSQANADQADLDGDNIGDACDNNFNCTSAGIKFNNFIQSLISHPGHRTALTTKVTNAMASCTAANKIPAIQLLNAFINEVDAKKGKGDLTYIEASQLIQYAQNLIDAL